MVSQTRPSGRGCWGGGRVVLGGSSAAVSAERIWAGCSVVPATAGWCESRHTLTIGNERPHTLAYWLPATL